MVVRLSNVMVWLLFALLPFVGALSEDLLNLEGSGFTLDLDALKELEGIDPIKMQKLIQSAQRDATHQGRNDTQQDGMEWVNNLIGQTGTTPPMMFSEGKRYRPIGYELDLINVSSDADVYSILTVVMRVSIVWFDPRLLYFGSRYAQHWDSKRNFVPVMPISAAGGSTWVPHIVPRQFTIEYVDESFNFTTPIHCYDEVFANGYGYNMMWNRTLTFEINCTAPDGYLFPADTHTCTIDFDTLLPPGTFLVPLRSPGDGIPNETTGANLRLLKKGLYTTPDIPLYEYETDSTNRYIGSRLFAANDSRHLGIHYSFVMRRKSSIYLNFLVFPFLCVSNLLNVSLWHPHFWMDRISYVMPIVLTLVSLCNVVNSKWQSSQPLFIDNVWSALVLATLSLSLAPIADVFCVNLAYTYALKQGKIVKNIFKGVSEAKCVQYHKEMTALAETMDTDIVNWRGSSNTPSHISHSSGHSRMSFSHYHQPKKVMFENSAYHRAPPPSNPKPWSDLFVSESESSDPSDGLRKPIAVAPMRLRFNDDNDNDPMNNLSPRSQLKRYKSFNQVARIQRAAQQWASRATDSGNHIGSLDTLKNPDLLVQFTELSSPRQHCISEHEDSFSEDELITEFDPPKRSMHSFSSRHDATPRSIGCYDVTNLVRLMVKICDLLGYYPMFSSNQLTKTETRKLTIVYTNSTLKDQCSNIVTMFDEHEPQHHVKRMITLHTGPTKLKSKQDSNGEEMYQSYSTGVVPSEPEDRVLAYWNNQPSYFTIRSILFDTFRTTSTIGPHNQRFKTTINERFNKLDDNGLPMKTPSKAVSDTLIMSQLKLMDHTDFERLLVDMERRINMIPTRKLSNRIMGSKSSALPQASTGPLSVRSLTLFPEMSPNRNLPRTFTLAQKKGASPFTRHQNMSITSRTSRHSIPITDGGHEEHRTGSGYDSRSAHGPSFKRRVKRVTYFKKGGEGVRSRVVTTMKRLTSMAFHSDSEDQFIPDKMAKRSKTIMERKKLMHWRSNKIILHPVSTKINVECSSDCDVLQPKKNLLESEVSDSFDRALSNVMPNFLSEEYTTSSDSESSYSRLSSSDHFKDIQQMKVDNLRFLISQLATDKLQVLGLEQVKSVFGDLFLNVFPPFLHITFLSHLSPIFIHDTINGAGRVSYLHYFNGELSKSRIQSSITRSFAAVIGGSGVHVHNIDIYDDQLISMCISAVTIFFIISYGIIGKDYLKQRFDLMPPGLESIMD